MSHHKFAAITGSLLARKGEAGPSSARQLLERDVWIAPLPSSLNMHPLNMRPATRTEIKTEVAPPMAAIPAPPPMPRPAPSKPRAGDASLRKVALRLTEEQHRRLRVVAAQLQVSHQALLAAALENHLAAVCKDRLSSCNCLGTTGTCCSGD